MPSRLERHEKIVELIQKYPIDTQEELALRLDIRPYRKKCKNSTYKERYEKNDDIPYYRGACL